MTKTLRIPGLDLQAGRVVLSGPTAHYVSRVQRCRPGDALLFFDAQAGVEAAAVIVSLDAVGVICEVEAPRVATRRGVAWLELVQALGKGDKPEDTLRGAVALGVGAVTFVESARSVVRMGERTPQKQARLAKVAIEAARQSLRGDLPELRGPLAFNEQLKALKPATDGELLRLVLHPAIDCQPLLAALAAHAPKRLELWVGPEGGFSESEYAALLATGALPVSLGPLVLRTELAATAALAATLAWALANDRWDL